MGTIAGIVWACIVTLGPIELDFWTEIGLIFVGAVALSNK